MPVKKTEGWQESVESKNARRALLNDLDSFKTWWEPFSTDAKTGASIGGQKEAWRWWSRPPEPTKEDLAARDGFGKQLRWERRQYGLTARVAIKCKAFYGWWVDWLDAGSPKGQWVQFLDEYYDGKLITEVHNEPFVSHCLPLTEQSQRLGEIYKMIGDKRYIA